MSGGSTSTVTQLDPKIRDTYLSNLERSQNLALGTPLYGEDIVTFNKKGKETSRVRGELLGYEGGLQARQFTGFNPDQQSAFDIVRNFADPNSIGMQRVGEGAAAVGRAATYSPQTVTGQQVSAQGFAGAQIDPVAKAIAEQASRAGVRDVSSATGAAGMQAYFNPFEDQVVQGALGDIERSRQMQQMQGAAAAQQARAFGGSRQGVAQALTNEAALRQSANTAAQLRSQGFETAAGLGQQDAARALDAALANQGIDASFQQSNADMRQAINLANQEAINQRARDQAGLLQDAGLFSAEQENIAARRSAELAQDAALANQTAGLEGANLNLSAGSQLADIGSLTQNLGFTQADQLSQIGQQQQELTQAQLDAIRNLPLEQQQIINAALGLTPAGGAGTTTRGSGSQFSLLG
jgi:hypothetical protein